MQHLRPLSLSCAVIALCMASFTTACDPGAGGALDPAASDAADTQDTLHLRRGDIRSGRPDAAPAPGDEHSDAAAPSADLTTRVIAVEAQVTFIFDETTQTYDGNPKVVLVETIPPGLPVTLTYDGSETPPTDAGSYTVLAVVDTEDIQGFAETRLTILPAELTITLSDLTQTYTGTTRRVTVTTQPPDVPVTVRYAGSTTAPINAGMYVLDVSAADPNYVGSADGVFTIRKAAATIILREEDRTLVFDGATRTLNVTTLPPGLTVTTQTLQPAGAQLRNAGTYQVRITATGPNHEGQLEAQIVIQRRPVLITLSNLQVTYNGQEREPLIERSLPTVPIRTTYNGNEDPPINAGAYELVVEVTDPNHVGREEAVFLILPRTLTSLQLNNLTHVYDGNPKIPVLVGAPQDAEVRFTYNGSSSPPVDAGNYAVIAQVTSQNNVGSASGTLVINRAPVTFSFPRAERPYTGEPLPIEVVTNPPNVPYTLTYDGQSAPPVNVGLYQVSVDSASPNHQGTGPRTVAYRIVRGSADFVFGPLEVTYDSSAKPLSVTTIPEGLPVVMTYGNQATPPTNAGSVTVRASVDTPQWTGSRTETYVIRKATADIQITGLAQRADGRPKPVTVVTVPAGLQVQVTYDGSPTPPTNVGDYDVAVRVENPNYEGQQGGLLRLTCAPSQCSQGTERCGEGGGTVETCTLAPYGCTVWTPSQLCSAGQTCVDARCQNVCVNTCVEGELRCQGGRPALCAPDSNGCLDFRAQSPCAPNTTCREGVCTPDCSVQCSAGERRCIQGIPSVCTIDNACPRWDAVEFCGANQRCEEGACVQDCRGTCTPGTTRCGSGPGVLETCTETPDACPDWTPSSCASGEVCEAGTCARPTVTPPPSSSGGSGGGCSVASTSPHGTLPGSLWLLLLAITLGGRRARRRGEANTDQRETGNPGT